MGFVGSVHGATRPAPLAVLPMDVASGRPTIELRINGHGPYTFLVDTGFGRPMMLNQDLADELALAPTGTRSVGDPNDTQARAASLVSLDRVEAGALSIDGVDAMTWPRDGAGVRGYPRGVVGPALFRPHPVTLDYPSGRLVVESQGLPEADGRTVFDAIYDAGIPAIPIFVAGRRFHAHLDSGSTGFIGVPFDAADHLPLAAAPVEVGRARTASGDYPVTEARLEGELRIGGLVLEKPKLRFIGLPSANIGSDFLRASVLTLDRKNERVRLVTPGRAPEPTDRPRFGIHSTGIRDGRFAIDEVAEGSAAKVAGLRAGDQIVRLNDALVTEMNAFELSLTLAARPLTISLVRGGAPLTITIEKPVAEATR